MGQGPEVMTRQELDLIIQTFNNLGFTVEWVDTKAETLLVRATPAR